jgi:hypothetical protein
MKIPTYLLLLLSCMACANVETKEAPSTAERMELVPEPDKDLREQSEKQTEVEPKQIHAPHCDASITDFLRLTDVNMQAQLFAHMDSVRTIQYPDQDQETSIMVDLTPEYLNKFLVDLNLDSFATHMHFEQEYHFHVAPKDFTDPPKCTDKISVRFDTVDCSFHLYVMNTFLVEPDWCTENMVVYGFKIEKDRILDFWRQEAG